MLKTAKAILIAATQKCFLLESGFRIQPKVTVLK